MSHKDETNKTCQNIGYWGMKQNCMPFEGASSKLPNWLLRARKSSELPENLGTTIHVLGFRAAGDWEKVLVAISSILQLVKQETLSGYDWRLRFDEDKIQILLSSEAKNMVDVAIVTELF